VLATSLMDSAGHVIKRILDLSCLSYMTSYDVARTFHESLRFGDML